MDTLRLEKPCCLIPGEMSIEYRAFEWGLGTELEIEFLGQFYKTTVIAESHCGHKNEKLRA